MNGLRIALLSEEEHYLVITDNLEDGTIHEGANAFTIGPDGSLVLYRVGANRYFQPLVAYPAGRWKGLEVYVDEDGVIEPHPDYEADAAGFADGEDDRVALLQRAHRGERAGDDFITFLHDTKHLISFQNEDQCIQTIRHAHTKIRAAIICKRLLKSLPLISQYIPA